MKKTLQQSSETESSSGLYGFIENLLQIYLRNSHGKFPLKLKNTIKHETNRVT